MWKATLLLVVVADALVFFHELGHLLAAKWAGMPVTSFSVGFGPRLFSFRLGATRYQLALIPLGGFVRIMGMNGTEAERRQWPHGFAFQPLGRRLFVIAAGVMMNAFTAGVIYALLAVSGGASLPTPARIAGMYEENLPAEAVDWATVPSDLAIVSIGTKPVKEWSDLALAILSVDAGRQEIRFSDGSRHTVTLPAEPRERIDLLRAMLPPLPAVLGRITPGSAADVAGLRTGDRILAADGIRIETVLDWIDDVLTHPAAPLTITVRRAGRVFDTLLVPVADAPYSDGSFGWLGAYLGDARMAPDVRGAAAYGLRQVERNAHIIAQSGKMLLTGGLELRELSGPVEIARMSDRALEVDVFQFLEFVAFLSLSLAILNFLPVPVLDGGHFFLLLAEGLRGAPLPRIVYRYANLAGATVVGFFMTFALVNDVLKLFGI